MVRSIRMVLICAALGGCASAGSLPSLSSLGGSEGRDLPPKEAPAQETQSSESSSSGLGGIWSNFSSVFSSGAQPVASKPAMGALDANEALRLVNDYRSKKGLRPVSLDPRASAAAQVLVQDMAKHDHMSHIGPRGQDVGKRLISAGYSYRVAAENVGVGQTSLSEMIDGWKKSPPHSRNMLLKEAKNIGIAYEYKPDTKYKTFWALVVAAP